MDDLSFLITMIVFVVFLILAGYYFVMKKANDQAFLLVIFGFVFLLASFTDLLDFILPVLFLLFFVSIFTQYLRKRQLHQLVWSISLFMFFLTTLFQALATLLGTWNAPMLQTYYVFASFQVLLLGSGELYLLAKRNIITKNTNIVVVFISGFFWMLFGFIYNKYLSTETQVFLYIAFVGILVMVYGVAEIIFAVLKKDRFQVSAFQYSNFVLGFSFLMFIMAVYYTFTTPFNSGYDLSAVAGVQAVIDSTWNTYSSIRGFAPLFTVNGAMFIFLGSIYSYILWQLNIRRKQGHFSPSTGIFNLYFAIGVAIFTAGGTFSQLGGVTVLYISELLGGIFMYFGFLESDKISMELIMDIVTLRFLHKHYEQSQMLTH